jgi:hypothetical protein
MVKKSMTPIRNKKRAHVIREDELIRPSQETRSVCNMGKKRTNLSL